MGDDKAVRKLVEMLSAFFAEQKALEEDLTCSLTSEFLQNIKDVLFTKQLICNSKFRNFFESGLQRMLLSPEMYLRYLFYACLQETLVNLNIFERFLSTFAIILRICFRTRYESGMDFRKLVPDIFMLFYEKELKETFGRRHGFRQLVKYINNPKYLESKCVGRNMSHNFNVSIDELPKDFSEKFFRILREEPQLPKSFNFIVPEVDPYCRKYAKEVLEIARTKFISLPSDDGLKINLSEPIPQKITILGKKRILEASNEVELTLESCPTLSADSKTNDGAVICVNGHERYENIIEAVTRHNHSKSSCQVKAKGRIQTETHGILEHLKSTIDSLIQVLDDDKE